MDHQADVIVIGGGIIGTATAYYLARRGTDVMLLEKDAIAHGQSSRAWGFIRQQRRDFAELPLMIECNKMWPGLSAELGAEFEWTQNGIMALATTEERMSYYREWYERSREYDVESKLLTTADIRQMIPEMQGAWVGGIYTPSDGHAEPGPVTRAFADAARRNGARIQTGVTVDGIDKAGSVVRGVSVNGLHYRANTVVCAAGVWSGRLARTIGLTLPQLAVRQTVVEVDPRRHITDVATWTPTVAFRQRPGGTLYLARPDDADFDVDLDSLRFARQFLPNFRANRRAFRMHFGKHLVSDLPRVRPGSTAWRQQFHESAGTETEPNPDVVQRCRHSFIRLFPHLGEAELVRSWGGSIDTTPDALPVMGESRDVSGFVWATGFSGHGFGIGPIAGMLLAQLIDEGRTDFDLSAFRAERFSEKQSIKTTKIA